MILARHTLETTATPEQIWVLWVDVPGYGRWDDSIEWARLASGFQVGATGELQPREGRRTAFTIVALEEGRSFSCLASLPFAQLRFTHSMEPTEMGTRLTHGIELSGALAWVWGRVLGPVCRSNLPIAMRKLARLAEQPAAFTRGNPE